MYHHVKKLMYTVNIGEPGAGERLFYDEAMGMNFRTGRAALPEIFAGIDANEGKRDAPAIYLAVRNGCEARLDRSTWLQLADIALSQGDGRTVTSGDALFSLLPE